MPIKQRTHFTVQRAFSAQRALSVQGAHSAQGAFSVQRDLSAQRGFTLIELIAFMIIISVGVIGLLSTFNQTVSKSVDPIIKVRALELAQAQLDEVMARKFDTSTPTGGIPACSAATTPCDGFNAADQGNFDDVDDYQGFSATPPSSYLNYSVDVSVSYAGNDLPGLVDNQAAKLVTVTVTMPDGSTIRMSRYKVNF